MFMKTLSALCGPLFPSLRRALSVRRALLSIAALAVVTSAACTPPAEQIAQARADQHWAAEFRQVRQQCSQQAPGSCVKFERFLVAQQAYTLYYSRAVPGLASPMFVPASGVNLSGVNLSGVNFHPVSISGFR